MESNRGRVTTGSKERSRNAKEKGLGSRGLNTGSAPTHQKQLSKLFNSGEEVNCGPGFTAVGQVARVLGGDVLLSQWEPEGSSARSH